ncbi:hypothetical protein B0T18DRAFT_26486 [Schizothecium vesticola]|uniref:Uncharacterized protein n=1 Tax=Schizothecium vesticola TaxID=314040 RepID=A0AA40KCK6_9PEZI|nr:hypothetical protein B0T18DRAFT_26486 [Schizothecium vesticola]
MCAGYISLPFPFPALPLIVLRFRLGAGTSGIALVGEEEGWDGSVWIGGGARSEGVCSFSLSLRR